MTKIKASDFLEADDKFIDAVAERINSLNQEKGAQVLKQYSIKNVCDITKKGKQTIGAHIKKGLLKATKPGKSWIITHESLMDYLKPSK
jgi:excisionase family DNA binding protein